MSNKQILVTGGTGFFGCSLLEQLREGKWQEYSFTLLSRNAEKFAALHPEFAQLANAEFVSADVCNLSALQEEYAYIIHAATPLINQPCDEELRKIILTGTQEVPELAKRAGTEKLLYISSGGVYGNGTAPFSEEMVCNPVSAYGKAKLEAEQLVLQSSIPSSIMRGFAFCGKHLPRDAHFAFGNFLEAALNNQEIIIKGDGTPLRSYMHADDLACWMMTMLFKGENKRIYNCGSDVSISIRELAELIKKVTNSQSNIKVLTPPPAPGTPVNSYVPEISRARQELGLNLTYSLPEAVRKFCF